MYIKLLIICTVMAFASSLEYPSRVHPAICPNYPYCDLSTLARHTPEGIPIPEWEVDPALLPQAPVVQVAGVQPSVCPNNPNCF